MTFLSQLKGKKFLSRLVPTTAARHLIEQVRFRPGLESLEDRVLMAATITVNATANVHAIDPIIYGTAFATTAQLPDLNLTDQPRRRQCLRHLQLAGRTPPTTAATGTSRASPAARATGRAWIPSSARPRPAAPSPSLTLESCRYAAKLGVGPVQPGQLSRLRLRRAAIHRSLQFQLRQRRHHRRPEHHRHQPARTTTSPTAPASSRPGFST